MNIKPIETVYNGYRFRSRLEARWAVFLDATGFSWEYEPEGITLSNGENYLPDFYLPKCNTFIEVKHKDAFSFVFENGEVYGEDGTERAEKYLYAIHDIVSKGKNFLIVFGDPLDALKPKWRAEKAFSHNFFCGVECIFHKAMELCEDKTEFECYDGTKCLECEKYDLGMSAEYIVLMANGQIVIADTLDSDNEDDIERNKRIVKDVCEKEIYLLSQLKKENDFGAELVQYVEAMKKARQARFEHNEKPII